MQKSAFSILEFCQSHGISRSNFYNLQKDGIAPQVLCVGRRRLITVEAADEWRRRLQKSSSGGRK